MPLIADWQAIARTREHHVNENLRRANRKQHQYDYAPGQHILKKVHNPAKLGVRTEGPYTIERVHVNGNLTILLREAWLGNPFRIPRNSAINLIPDLLNSKIFIRILFSRS